MLKKIFLSLFVSLFLLTQYVTPAKAETWFNQDPMNWFKKVHDTSISPEPEIFGERYTAAQVQWIFYSVITFPFTLLGSDIMNCVLSPDPSCLEIVFNKLKVEAEKHPEMLAQNNESPWETLTKDRPLSGITYVKTQLRELELIPSANAQQAGFGFAALNPVLNMWQMMRNVSYVLLTLVTIVFAFMIMFRVKISPQIVISAQSAIPKLVTAIILVTFSYAIAGFMVDLMYVVIGLVSLVFGTRFVILTEVPIFISFIAYIIFFLIASAVVIFVNLGAVITGVVGGVTIGAALLLPNFALLLLLLFFIIYLVVVILLVIHFLRTLFMLIRAFANVLLLVIFAPLQLIAGALIESIGFTAWLRSLLSNLAVFVVTGLLLHLSIVFLILGTIASLRAFVGEDILHNVFNIVYGINIVNMATLESAGWPPLLGWGSEQGVGFVMLGASFVVFTLIPRTAEIVQGLISGRPFAYGTAIGEAVAPVRGGVQLITGTATGAVQRGATNVGGDWIQTRWNEWRGRGTQGETSVDGNSPDASAPQR